MGLTCANISLRDASQRKVVTAVEASLHDCPAIVSPEINGWVTVFGDGLDSMEIDLATAVAALSKICKVAAIACLVYDSDVLLIWVFDPRGQEVVAYNSNPDYFSDVVGQTEISADDVAAAIASICGDAVTVDSISIVLEEDVLFEEDKLKSLGKVLGTRNMAWGFGTLLEDAENGNVEDFDKYVQVEG